MKEHHYQVIVFILVAIVALALVFLKEKTVTAPNVSSVQTQPIDAAFANLDLKTLQTKDFSDESNPAVDISGTYPVGVVGASYVKSQIDGLLPQFRSDTDTSSMSPEELNDYGPSKDNPYMFTVTYSASKDPYYFTHRIDVYTYTGGAHGGTAVYTYTYDAKGNLVTFPSMLIDQTTALKAFSDKVETLLKSPEYEDKIFLDQLDGTSNDGAGPSVDNFDTFGFDGANLVLIFQQYQVGPYTSGILEVPIPFSDLQGILKPEFLRQ